MRTISGEDILAAKGERLDIALSGWLELSRSVVQQVIGKGMVTVKPAPRKTVASYRLRGNETVTVGEIELPASENAPPAAEDIPLDIVHEDKSLIVLNKPPGLVVHPGAGHATGTLVNALMHHCGSELADRGGLARLGIVHRLDMETSGLLIVAKDNRAHENLSKQFASRTVRKSYHAVVWGLPRRPSGECRENIGRHRVHRQKMAVIREGGRTAHTTYRTLRAGRIACLLECDLHTGRTHQIRVHLSHHGMPIVGDALYGGMRKVVDVALPPHHLLHAAQIAFLHPRSGKEAVFRAPDPRSFADFMAQPALGF